MKKILYLFVLLSVVAGLSSCEQDSVVREKSTQEELLGEYVTVQTIVLSNTVTGVAIYLKKAMAIPNVTIVADGNTDVMVGDIKCVDLTAQGDNVISLNVSGQILAGSRFIRYPQWTFEEIDGDEVNTVSYSGYYSRTTETLTLYWIGTLSDWTEDIQTLLNGYSRSEWSTLLGYLEGATKENIMTVFNQTFNCVLFVQTMKKIRN